MNLLFACVCLSLTFVFDYVTFDKTYNTFDKTYNTRNKTYNKRNKTYNKRNKTYNTRTNGITLLAVLTVCARSKLVDLGIQLFTFICSEYKIIPTSKHYCCMVDLIGRAGLLVDAVNFIKNLPYEPDASVLRALLGACKIHEDSELGNKVGKRLIGLQPQHCGQYVALSTLNALDNNWTEAEHMRKVIIEAGVRKIPAYSVLC